MRYVEFIVWNVRLWLVDFGQRVRDREVQLAARTTWDSDTIFARFVDRVAPWQTGIGYKRRSLRRWLYRLRYPITAQRFWSLSLVQHAIYRLVPRPTYGRYEHPTPSFSLIAEWFDDNSELAEDTTGDSDTYLWAAMFSVIPPWSREIENWMLTVDTRGFVDATRYDGWELLREAFVMIEEHWLPEPGDDTFEEPWPNAEGDPTLNGAFGGVQVAQ